MGFYHGHHFWGMHFMWWIIWIPLLIWFIVRPWPFKSGHHHHSHKETPLDILKRRYANGEISTEEYQERKKELEGEL